MQLEKGMWIKMRYGFDPRKFLILKVGEDYCTIVGSTWPLSGAVEMSIKDMKSRPIRILGRGKKKSKLRKFFSIRKFPYTKI